MANEHIAYLTRLGYSGTGGDIVIYDMETGVSSVFDRNSLGLLPHIWSMTIRAYEGYACAAYLHGITPVDEFSGPSFVSLITVDANGILSRRDVAVPDLPPYVNLWSEVRFLDANGDFWLAISPYYWPIGHAEPIFGVIRANSSEFTRLYPAGLDSGQQYASFCEGMFTYAVGPNPVETVSKWVDLTTLEVGIFGPHFFTVGHGQEGWTSPFSNRHQGYIEGQYTVLDGITSHSEERGYIDIYTRQILYTYAVPPDLFINPINPQNRFFAKVQGGKTVFYNAASVPPTPVASPFVALPPVTGWAAGQVEFPYVPRVIPAHYFVATPYGEGYRTWATIDSGATWVLLEYSVGAIGGFMSSGGVLCPNFFTGFVQATEKPGYA